MPTLLPQICFNPRPPLLAGDAHHLGEHGVGDGVSIRARHCWRAMHACRRSVCCATPRFNPRPPLLAGDAAGNPGIPGSLCVSIRARHCWRAMRVLPGAQLYPEWFQSAPAIAGGRCEV